MVSDARFFADLDIEILRWFPAASGHTTESPRPALRPTGQDLEGMREALKVSTVPLQSRPIEHLITVHCTVNQRRCPPGNRHMRLT